MQKLLTKKELADLLGVNIGSVNVMMKRGCPFLRLGDNRRCRTRFEVEKVREWLVANGEAGKKG